MSTIIWCLIAIVLGSWISTRLVGSLLIWLSWKLIRTEVTIGCVGFFVLKNITLRTKNGAKIIIDAIWCSSSLLNSDLRKPFCLCFDGIHVHPGTSQISDSPTTPEETKTKVKVAGPGPLSSSLLVPFQYIGMFVHRVDVHLPCTVIDCTLDVILTDLHAGLSHLQETHCVELSVSKVDSNLRTNRTVAEETLATLSFTAALAVNISRDGIHAPVQNVSLLVKMPRGFVKEELLRVVSMRKSTQTTQPHSLPGKKFRGIVPMSANVKVEVISILVSRQQEKSNLILNIQSVAAQFTSSNDLATEQSLVDGDARGVVTSPGGSWSDRRAWQAGLSMTRWEVSGVVGQYAAVKTVEISTKADCTRVDYSLSVRDLTVLYHHAEVLYWLSILRAITQKPAQEPKLKPKHSRLLSYHHGKSVSVVVDLKDICTKVTMINCPGCTAGLRLFNVRLKTNPESRDVEPCMENVSFRCDVDLDTVYCKLGQVDGAQFNRALHTWDTVFYVGAFSAQVRKANSELGVDVSLDGIQSEWSTNAVDTVVHVIEIIQSTSSNAVPSVRQRDCPSPALVAEIGDVTLPINQRDISTSFLTELTLTAQCKISNINIFASNNRHVFVMCRLDGVTYNHGNTTGCVEVTGAKVITAQQTLKAYNLLRSGEVQNYIGHVQDVKVVVRTQKKEIAVNVLEEMYFLWSTGFHMIIKQILLDLATLKDSVKTISPAIGSSVIGSSEPSQSAFTIDATVRGNTLLAAQLSPEHRVSVSLPQFQATIEQRSKVTVFVDQLSIELDQHEIFQIQGLCVYSCHHSEDVEAERRSFETLESPTNKAWCVAMDRFGVVFPFKYNFALCWERLLRIKKFLKKLHSGPRRPFTADDPLPPDLVIKVKVIHIRINDDPFEVKLGDNYALMVDEHAESEKRFSAMYKRIYELRKKHGLLPAGKVEELYASLSQKNSNIYVQRSLQQYTTIPMRTALFTCKMEDLEVLVLADRSMHGKDNCIKHMRDIDAESPYPDEGLDFNTLLCRCVNASVSTWSVTLRDYHQPILDISDIHVWGRLVVAEQEGTKRAKYTAVVEVPDPWEDVVVEKNMPAPKFYHDFSCDVEAVTLAYGSCWEPCLAQYNLSMDHINKPSLDPSKQMPFWDKLRLLLHGRLTMSMQQMSWLYHTSLDPYNRTEFMDWTWTKLVFDWTSGKFVLKGDLDIYLRTASKYDDCRFLHLPNLRFCVGLEWLCLGHSLDHHNVMPCAPDKVPEYSLEEHDSYRAFRSQAVNMQMSMETKPCQDEEGFDDIPCWLFYSTTARFLEKIKMCLARVSRPIKRGRLYFTNKPRKPPLSRHYKNVSISLKFCNSFQVCYWASFAKQNGLEMSGRSFSLDGAAQLTLIQTDEGLKRRPVANWSVSRLQMNLDAVQTWVCSTSQDDEADEVNTSMRNPVNRSFLFSINKLVYSRDEDRPPVPMQTQGPDVSTQPECEKPTHQVHIHNLKGAWTLRNRNIMIRLYDGYSKAAALRRALSSDALKGFKMEGSNTPLKKPNLSTSSSTLATPSPVTRIQSGHAFSLLQKLVAETDSKFVAFTEEPSGANMEQLRGVMSCQTGDVIKRNWLIELSSSQVMLKGIETKGYVIVSAAQARILSCEHQPVWRDQQLKTKTTWVGGLECMQYYSTVDNQADDEMYWLVEENVAPRGGDEDVSGIPEMAGSGQSVGGVVTRTVDTQGEEYSNTMQLQRIISRCKCQFFYASYGEADPTTLPEVPPIPGPDQMRELERSFEDGVDSLTLLHHDLNVCTNSNQYHMMLDIVNNLVLYVEPKKKIYTEKLQSLRFKLELSSIEDQKTPILALQEKLRQHILSLRSVERQLYMIHRKLDDDPFNESLVTESDELERRLFRMKEQMSNDGEDLGIMISGFIGRQLEMKMRHKAMKAGPAMVLRRTEVCFKHAQWRLTETDGQIGIADLVLRNFLYVKTNNNDDSFSHLLELGWAKMQNLLPNSIYKDVLMPQDTLGKGHLDDVAMRIVCRVKPPVGGISVKEHLEINLVPIIIQITKQFYRAMMAFFFPDNDVDQDNEADADDTASTTSSESGAKSRKSRADDQREKERRSSFRSYVELPGDIDKMKERAARNNTFLHVKIPELPLRISYKGERDKNVTDVHDMLIRLPPLEIHNQTWTWLDLLMAVKNSSKRALLSQAIKQKLRMRSKTGEELVTDVQQEEDKVKMLLGAKLLGGTDKPSSKKNLFGKSK